MTASARRGEIHLGDLIRALATLDWQGDEHAKAIAACLGFGITPAKPPEPTTEIYDRRRYRVVPPEPQQPAEPSPVFVPPTPEPPPTLPAHALASQLEALGERVPAAPDNSDWLDDDEGLFTEEDAPTLARQSIFPEHASRHLVSAALVTQRSGEEIDVPKLISAVSRREVIRDLPRRAESTLERGCHLLLDYSATMVPFWEDLNALIRRVAEVVGLSTTRVFSFDTRPSEAIFWTPTGQRVPWRSEGRPVLAATDFAIQGKSGRGELNPSWHDFIAQCADARCPLVILIPWSEDRWPRTIGPYPELVHWSPHTTAAMIKNKIGRGHRLG